MDKITVSTKTCEETNGIYFSSHHRYDTGTKPNVCITEIRVPGNVTGILIPNTNNITVRIYVPIDDDGVEFKQDLSYLEWTTVNLKNNNNLFVQKLINNNLA